MSIIGILKIMEVQEDDMEVQEEAVISRSRTRCKWYFHISVVNELNFTITSNYYISVALLICYFIFL